MGEQPDVRGDAPTTDGPPSDTLDAQEAHGGSMAPGLVDETGHLIAEPADGGRDHGEPGGQNV
ncbi:hypothetical protein [Virgisporangium aurantiacum]|uniref:Uncharacterized protein n=1 Tax=Virgisporangium aurantiacum TaxID=175570 RepID=A0A8J3ZG61_9ACTN|nr:hypothetical protein [Virgisporangium aurantiacum]GIJ62287.1 hypothetical protein Vau01_098030 [Virgisporangium aurantiacum]